MKTLPCRFVAICVAGLVLAAGAAADQPQRPNIIVIMVDDMGFSDIGCYGAEIPTPNLDLLAGNGVRFSQFYNTGRCCPTRASLLTGLYSHQAGVGWMTAASGGNGQSPPTSCQNPRPSPARTRIKHTNFLISNRVEDYKVTS